MKRLEWALILLLVATPAWSARKLTVQQLKDLLTSLQQAQKTDIEVATELRDVELTEELTRATMNSLVPLVPGQLATEQIFVLEARSAVLAPPTTDLPASPAPDAASQKAILDNAIAYATKTFAQMPAVTATKTTRRFQDNVEPAKPSPAARSAAVVAPPAAFIRYMKGEEATVTILNGAEQNPLLKDKEQWGANGRLALLGQSPVLSTVIQEAQTAGKIEWVRWESVNGKQTAVYSYAVDKKKSHYAVNYCCFPDTDQAGQMLMRGLGPGAGGAGTAPAGGTGEGNYQLNTNYKNYKATVPYHGEIFVDPDTGAVVRLITEAEFKSSELVRQEDQRIDYGPVTIGGKTLILPVRTVINTLAIPDGDTVKGVQNPRHTLFTSEYKNYQSAGS
jgi:hypothetical protein